MIIRSSIIIFNDFLSSWFIHDFPTKNILIKVVYVSKSSPSCLITSLNRCLLFQNSNKRKSRDHFNTSFPFFAPFFWLSQRNKLVSFLTSQFSRILTHKTSSAQQKKNCEPFLIVYCVKCEGISVSFVCKWDVEGSKKWKLWDMKTYHVPLDYETFLRI